jgi:hypothetical protein
MAMTLWLQALLWTAFLLIPFASKYDVAKGVLGHQAGVQLWNYAADESAKGGYKDGYVRLEEDDGAHDGAHGGAHDGGGASAPLMRRLGAHEDAPSWLLHCPTDGKLRPHFVLRDPTLALKAEVKGSRFLIRFTYALMTSDCDCDQSPPMAPSTAL